MLKRALHYFTFLCLAGLLVTGCSDTSTIDDPPVPATLPTPFPGFTFPVLDLANSRLPIPNDLLRNPATGNLNFPQTTEPFLAANSLDGWSTAGDIIIEFRGNVVPESVTNDTIRVINNTTQQAAPMTFEVVDTQEGARVKATPVFTLNERTTYLVIVTNGVISADSNSPILSDANINIVKDTEPLVDGNGNVVSPELIAAGVSSADAQGLEAVRLGYLGIWSRAESVTGQDRSNIPLAFEFTTQSLRDVLPSLRNTVRNTFPTLIGANPSAPAGNQAAANLPVAAGNTVPTLGAFGIPSVSQLRDGLVNGTITIPGVTLTDALRAQLAAVNIAGIGRIHVASFQAPIFRDTTQGFFADPPVQVGTRTVPALIFLPSETPSTVSVPAPVLIFQHGITGQKELAFGLAGGVNAQGYALIAIDLELHGPFSLPGQPSGTGFINPANLRNSRDNIRTSVTNLYALVDAIASGRTDFDDASGINPAVAGVGNDFLQVSQAPASPVYVGHSLGAIVGTVLHSTEQRLVRSALNVGGGRINKLLLGSAAFRQPIVDGLAASGIVEGTTSFDQFFAIAQAVVDDADPINYAKVAIDGNLRGDETAQILQQANLVDVVVPPSAQSDLAIQFGQGTPTAGSAAFTQVDAIGTPLAIAAQASTPFAGPGVYQIPTFSHGAILGIDGVAAAAAIFGQAFNFDATGAIVDTGIRARQLPVESTDDPANYRHAVSF